MIGTHAATQAKGSIGTEIWGATKRDALGPRSFFRFVCAAGDRRTSPLAGRPRDGIKLCVWKAIIERGRNI